MTCDLPEAAILRTEGYACRENGVIRFVGRIAFGRIVLCAIPEPAVRAREPRDPRGVLLFGQEAGRGSSFCFS
jgi:hypothetical protein